MMASIDRKSSKTSCTKLQIAKLPRSQFATCNQRSISMTFGPMLLQSKTQHSDHSPIFRSIFRNLRYPDDSRLRRLSIQARDAHC